MIRPTIQKTQDQVAREWDKLVKIRCEQIENGKDLSFNFVLLPMILELTEGADHSNVVDIGCGPGFLTKEFASKSKQIVGIDLSGESIKCAYERHGGIGNIEFVNSSAEKFISPERISTFSLAISNMALMTTLDLEATVTAIAMLLKRGGHFAFTTCHPWFWPRYWGYSSEPWFDYSREIAIEAPFKISLESDTGLITTHVHRPLHYYVRSLNRAGFVIDKVMEPIPNMDIERRYNRSWEYPRFLGMRCKKE
jgi:SAM-dependent methyltransferase